LASFGIGFFPKAIGNANIWRCSIVPPLRVWHTPSLHNFCNSFNYAFTKSLAERYLSESLRAKDVEQTVKKAYARIASENESCYSSSCSCGDQTTFEEISKSIGYSEEECNTVPEANLGLGCGNPTALGGIKEGDVVPDLGSGAGFDCFLAAKKVGRSGKVVGVDMTKEMVKKGKVTCQEIRIHQRRVQAGRHRKTEANLFIMYIQKVKARNDKASRVNF
jgi:SAM-dependent methyltransferase